MFPTNDNLKAQLIQNGYTGDLNTSLVRYLRAQYGLSIGDYNDLLYRHLGALGYTGSLNDRLHSWDGTLFSVSQLFSSGQIGAWYDFADGADLFDDSVGTTAVPSAGHIGLALDNSGGMVLGSERIADGTFGTSTGWTLGTWSISGGTLNSSGVGGPTGDATYTGGVSTTLGIFHKITFTVVTKTSTQIYFALGSASYVIFPAGTGTFTMYLPTTGTDGKLYVRKGDISAQISIDNLSVKSLPGNHARQATTGNQPIWQMTYAEFDAFDDYMTAVAGGGGTTGFLFAAAIRVTGTGTARTIWSDTGTNTGYKVTLNTSDQLVLSAGNNVLYTSAITTGTLTDGTDYVVLAWHDGANLNVSINNGTVATQAFVTTTAGTAGFTIGRDNGAATSTFGSRIYNIIYRKNDTSTTAERTSIANYLADKAGITL